MVELANAPQLALANHVPGGKSMRSRVVTALVTALVGGAGCAHAPQDGAVAEAAAPRAPAAAETVTTDLVLLEDIFWTCDYVATTRGVDATPMRECALATRELRRVKFDNSFQRMLAWWRENKPVEHGKRRQQRNDPEL
jgi:hypothetical protein